MTDRLLQHTRWLTHNAPPTSLQAAACSPAMGHKPYLPAPLLWVIRQPLKSDLASPFEESPIVLPSSPVENTLKKVPICTQKIILSAFSINSSAIFALGRVLAVDSTASSENIPEPKYLIYYLGEISLNQDYFQSSFPWERGTGEKL